MADPLEREDFESLLKAPGWLRLVRHFREAYDGNVLEQRLRSHRGDMDKSSHLLIEWLCEKQAVESVLAYPQNRARSLRSIEEQLR